MGFDSPSPSCTAGGATKYHYVQVNKNGVTKEGLNMLFSTALTAFSTDKRVVTNWKLLPPSPTDVAQVKSIQPPEDVSPIGVVDTNHKVVVNAAPFSEEWVEEPTWTSSDSTFPADSGVGFEQSEEIDPDSLETEDWVLSQESESEFFQETADGFPFDESDSDVNTYSENDEAGLDMSLDSEMVMSSTIDYQEQADITNELIDVGVEDASLGLLF